jgi:hypothetical protein
MRFALVNGQKTEPQPKLQGLCTNCQGEMIAKCGRVKIWHWAHKSKLSCDPWWENETEWHRAWKNNFPAEWQEISNIDPVTGEKHIADVKTPYGLSERSNSANAPITERRRGDMAESSPLKIRLSLRKLILIPRPVRG